MATFVPDASAALPWCFEDEATEAKDRLRGCFSLISTVVARDRTDFDKGASAGFQPVGARVYRVSKQFRFGTIQGSGKTKRWP